MRGGGWRERERDREGGGVSGVEMNGRMDEDERV